MCFSFLGFSCTAVKPYQRIYVDDSEMQMSNSSLQDFNSYIFSIREGSTPAGNGKSSGGCGCN
jgi:hypothetical protein